MNCINEGKSGMTKSIIFAAIIIASAILIAPIALHQVKLNECKKAYSYLDSLGDNQAAAHCFTILK